jgi:hypothetical protein
MQIFKIDKDKFIAYENDTAKVYSRVELLKQKEESLKRLEEIPPKPTDKELLEWARTNYPQVNYEVEKRSLEAKVAECKLLLEKI